jgi:S1-C subfamily serine protease
MSVRIVSFILGALAASAITAAIVLAVADDGGSNGQTTAQLTGSPAPAATKAAQQTSGSNTSLTSGCIAAADVYANVHDSVVQITNTVQAQRSGGTQQTSGSGIIIASDGTILTNNHVVTGGGTLAVRFTDGSTAPADVLGTDPGDDLAVIRVAPNGRNLTVATLGDSDAIRPGDQVLAIGAPFGFEGTITEGIVSATGRTFAPGGQGTRPIRNMIQTDAPVNPGNSGGPLLDCQGKVVGINTALENPTGQDFNVGIAFAVPINTATRLLPDLQANQTVSHAWLGIAGEDITQSLVDELHLPVNSGVYVTLVSANSPAQRAGLQPAFASETDAQNATSIRSGGDIILSVDGHDVKSVSDLAGYLDSQKKPGDAVELKVQRGDQAITVQATLAEWPSN